MVDLIDATLNFFQTADGNKPVGSLAYYQQKEWRLTRIFLITYEALVRTCAPAPRPDPGGVHGVLQLFRPVLDHRHPLPAT